MSMNSALADETHSQVLKLLSSSDDAIVKIWFVGG